MHALRQSCRPKHQALVLKCYPRSQKNAVDIRPNQSELSYLLYYASTRRSKVQKVAAFLEKRTSSDVWRGRLGNVQVTLQILRALIEKSTRDLPLYAPAVLRILGMVLRSKDLTMVEDSIPTFETFCVHHDGASLAADQEYLRQYESIVRIYASFATEPAAQGKGGLSPPMALRWRSVGLQAIRSIASSDALGSDAGRQLNVIVPVILENLYSDEEDHLQLLQQRAHVHEQSNDERAVKRRMSVATVQTAETNPLHPAAVSGSTADADKLAEEHIGLLALQSLKQIFEFNSRGQIRTATAALLQFIGRRVRPRAQASEKSSSQAIGGWATTLVELVARWAPVQDRYVILVTAMETLVTSPVVEENVEQQLVLASLISWLLSSDVNLIGLSVMDVLVGLIQHVLQLLQLGGKGTAIQPHLQQTHAINEEFPSRHVSPERRALDVAADTVTTPSPRRKELLLRLQRCIGDLATHIYYSDQISDMVSAILLRLKPSPLSGVVTTVDAIENPEAAARAISASANLQENEDTDEFFSFETARVIGLEAVKEVLTVANMQASGSGAAGVGRNRVSVEVWEGTQWLLRDPGGRVRRAYVEALCTWLRLEASNSDLRAKEDEGANPRTSYSSTNLAKRAISHAPKEKARPARSTFLQLLHLAVYDNALHHCDSEKDVLLLHVLLANLVAKLGVDAVKSGLPMIMRLQEESSGIESPNAKVRICSLVYGYLWTVCEKFDLDTSPVGALIHDEIFRRKSNGVWREKVRVPPMQFDEIGTPEDSSPREDRPHPVFHSGGLKPFDGREVLVDGIARAYTASFESPPGSPPSSPGRKYSTTTFNGRPTEVAKPTLPEKIRQQILSDWSRDAIVSACENESSQSASLNGSKSGTTRSGARNLHPGNGVNGASNGGSHHHHHSHSQAPSVTGYGLIGNGGLGALQRLHRGSGHDHSPSAVTNSSRSSTVRVSQLRRVLSDHAVASASSRGRREPESPSTDSASMFSVDLSTSEASQRESGLWTGKRIVSGSGLGSFARQRSRSRSRERERERGDHRERSDTNETIRAGAAGGDDAGQNERPVDGLPPNSPVPPVPPLPASVRSSSVRPRRMSNDAPSADSPYAAGARSSTRRAGTGKGKATVIGSAARYSEGSGVGGGIGGGESGTIDLKRFLSGIDTGSAAGGAEGTEARGVGMPPY